MAHMTIQFDLQIDLEMTFLMNHLVPVRRNNQTVTVMEDISDIVIKDKAWTTITLIAILFFLSMCVVDLLTRPKKECTKLRAAHFCLKVGGTLLFLSICH